MYESKENVFSKDFEVQHWRAVVRFRLRTKGARVIYMAQGNRRSSGMFNYNVLIRVVTHQTRPHQPSPMNASRDQSN